MTGKLQSRPIDRQERHALLAARTVKAEAEARRLRRALKVYANSKNWKASRVDGPVDQWVNCNEEAWNGPDVARSALKRMLEEK